MGVGLVDARARCVTCAGLGLVRGDCQLPRFLEYLIVALRSTRSIQPLPIISNWLRSALSLSLKRSYADLGQERARTTTQRIVPNFVLLLEFDFAYGFGGVIWGNFGTPAMPLRFIRTF